MILAILRAAQEIRASDCEKDEGAIRLLAGGKLSLSLSPFRLQTPATSLSGGLKRDFCAEHRS